MNIAQGIQQKSDEFDDSHTDQVDENDIELHVDSQRHSTNTNKDKASFVEASELKKR